MSENKKVTVPVGKEAGLLICSAPLSAAMHRSFRLFALGDLAHRTWEAGRSNSHIMKAHDRLMGLPTSDTDGTRTHDLLRDRQELKTPEKLLTNSCLSSWSILS